MLHLPARIIARATALRSANLAIIGALVLAVCTASAAPAPIVLTGADRRPATSLNGDWKSIVDPYSNGFSGYFKNEKQQPGGTRPIEYDFSKSPALKVPGDWNTQRESLFYYEGPVW